jgi:mannose-1-phosphate guanylyltransferase
MLKVAGVPFIAHQIGYAKAHGITRIIVATSHKTEQFLAYLGDGSQFGVEIVHAIEQEPLGTGGAIANAAMLLQSDNDQPVAILNGDVLSAHDINAEIALHHQVRADVTLHLIEVEDARAFGSVPTDEAGRILDFVEKSENPPTRFINAGCYIFTRDLINRIPQGRVVSVERETFPDLLDDGLRLWSYKSEDYWIDIGTPAALRKASIDLVTGAFRSPLFTPSPEHTFIDSLAEIASSVTINAGCAIGASILRSGVVIDASVIGDGVVVESGAQISHSIIGNGVRIGSGAVVERSVIGGPGEFLRPNSRHIGEM